MSTQEQNLKDLYASYDNGNITILYDNTSLEEQAANPCSTETQWILKTDSRKFVVPINGLRLAADVPIQNRFKAVGGGPKRTINYPCSACVLGTDIDDLAINRWKKGLPNTAYLNCYKDAANGNPEYWDICCIINQILFKDIDSGICGQQANSYANFQYWAKELYGTQLPNNPCNNGTLQFLATIRPVLQIRAQAEVSVATPNGIVTKKGKKSLVVKHFGKQVSVVGPLAPVVSIEKNAATGNQWPNKLEWNGYPKSCSPELIQQARNENRPCGFGCQECPTYKGTLSCGYRWFECRDYRYGFPGVDVRCTEVGLSTNPNVPNTLNNLGDIINASVNGDNVSICSTNLGRKASLPCAPLGGPVEGMFSYAKILADEINNTDIQALFNDAVDTAEENARNLLDSVPDKCSPVARKILTISYEWLYQ